MISREKNLLNIIIIIINNFLFSIPCSESESRYVKLGNSAGTKTE